ncbi:MAG: hypothetical protein ACHQKY_15190, partial [Terriglobia bacterium]
MVETQRWQLAASLFEKRGGEKDGTTSASAAGDARTDHAMGGDAPGMKMMYLESNQIIPVFIRGLAAAHLATKAEDQSVQALQVHQQQLTGTFDAYEAKVTKIRELEVKAMEA